MKPSNDLASLRNLGIMAHIDAGKTTVTERILYYTGRIHKLGEVHDGAATMDSMDQEMERGITISSAATQALWGDARINIIDTPGHIDFGIEVERSLRVLDGALCVFDGNAGVQPQSETVWRQADRYGVPRLALINKLDKVGASMEVSVQSMRDKLGTNAVPLHQQIGFEDGFVGVVDLVEMKAITWTDVLGTEMAINEIPTELLDAAHEGRKFLIDAVAEFDDELMETYLTDETAVTPVMLQRAIRVGTITNAICPVLAGSAFKNKGVQPLLDAIVAYLPSPLDVPAVKGKNPKTGEQETRAADPEGPLAALAFKIVEDKHGMRTFVRVYSGTLHTGDKVLNVATGKSERVGRILQMHANTFIELQEIKAGDIAALVGLKDATTGTSLVSESAPIALESIVITEPVITVAIEPKTRAEQEKLGAALAKLSREDPSFRVRTDEETGQVLIAGMGELHLEIIVDRVQREFNVEANIGAPQVAYRETAGNPVERVNLKFKRQTGGSGQYGHVVINLEPGEPGSGFEFVDKIAGGKIPKEYIPSVEAGMRASLNEGPIAGYPIVDVRVELIDGSYHDVDSSEMAFRIAGSMAFKEAMRRAKPKLLEPVMAVSVETPEEYLGDVMGDIAKRRGRVEGYEPRSGVQVVSAQVPLGSMFGYATDVRSMTQGRASFSMQPGSYEQVPASLALELAEGKSS